MPERLRNVTKTMVPQPESQLRRKTAEISALPKRDVNSSLRLIWDARETLQNKAFLERNLMKGRASPRGAKYVEPASVSEPSTERGD